MHHTASNLSAEQRTDGQSCLSFWLKSTDNARTHFQHLPIFFLQYIFWCRQSAVVTDCCHGNHSLCSELAYGVGRLTSHCWVSVRCEDWWDRLRCMMHGKRWDFTISLVNPMFMWQNITLEKLNGTHLKHDKGRLQAFCQVSVHNSHMIKKGHP